MSKIKFKCKRKLDNGNMCKNLVYTKMHKGLSITLEIQRLSKNIDSLKLQSLDVSQQEKKLIELKDISPISSDWSFTLTCSDGHEEDYTIDESE